jgi:hypothetical protein
MIDGRPGHTTESLVWRDQARETGNLATTRMRPQ